jgi:hypothetical protein
MLGHDELCWDTNEKRMCEKTIRKDFATSILLDIEKAAGSYFGVLKHIKDAENLARDKLSKPN